MMIKTLAFLVLPAFLGACGYVSKYEQAVYDYEPVYCYQSLGAVQCFDTPRVRDEMRLVNYYGPAPERYDRPDPAPEPNLMAPPAVNFFVLDPEPIPSPSPNAAGPRDLPWLSAKAPAEAASVQPIFVIDAEPDAGDRE